MLLRGMVFGSDYLLHEHRWNQRIIRLRVESCKADVHFSMISVANTVHVYETSISAIATSDHLFGEQIQVALMQLFELVVCACLRPV